jgi:UDP-N-acetylglucosamine 1-carboxyvinyltransferase
MLNITPVEKLNGSINISGAKNAVLPIMAASLLCNKKITLNSIPFLHDVKIMCDILQNLGCSINCDYKNEKLNLDSSKINSTENQYDLANKMRASILIMGSLLARFGKAKVWMPGGCAIGRRPIDLHIKGLAQMGVHFEIEHGCIIGKANKKLNKRLLQGANIYLDFPSVGATENLIMAAVLAEGETIIANAALEPEVVDLANFINSMGGNIEGAGTDTIRINGVAELNETDYTVIPDRIEAGTFMVAASMTEGIVTIKNVIPSHLKSMIAKLREMGSEIEIYENQLIIQGKRIKKAVDFKTLPYPGFPTDMQAQFMSALAVARGTGVITETVFENRFMHVDELKKMGANVKTEGRIAVIEGTKLLEGARVKATDLRAGAALIIAALTAKGSTQIENEYHIDRGYYKLEEKFKNLGVNIERVDI